MKVVFSSVLVVYSFICLHQTQFTGSKSSNVIVTHQIKNDSSEYKLYQVLDSLNRPICYYRDIETYPCTSKGVCKIMKVRMYWDFFGNYLQYVVLEDELTKLNHKVFTKKDYDKLQKILNDRNSGLKFCKYESLTSKEAEKKFHNVDAISGATSKKLNFDYINGAVKTTYSLWHLANGETCNEVYKLSKNWLTKLAKYSPSEINNGWQSKLLDLNNSIKSNKADDDLLVQKLHKSSDIEFNFILTYLYSKKEKLPKKIINNIVKSIDDNSNLKNVIAYNFLLSKKEYKYLKQINLSYKNVLFKDN